MIRPPRPGRLAALALASIAAAGCLKPAPPDGVIVCASRSPACPDGYSCYDGTCVRTANVPADQCGPDGGGTACTEYCDCMSAACTGVGIVGEFPDEGTCLRECCALTARAVGCRLSHCIYARDGIAPQPPQPLVHCPHALGAPPCNFP